MERFWIESVDDLVCPICYTSGVCKSHLVEVWSGSDRKNHLDAVFRAIDASIERKSEVEKQFPTPESCFNDCVLVSWQTYYDEQEMPLFVQDEQHTLKISEEFALFHREGAHLLDMYRNLLKDTLNKDQHIHRVLHLLGKKTASASQMKDKPVPASKTVSEQFVQMASAVPLNFDSTPSLIEDDTPPLHIEEEYSMVEDLMGNLL